MKILSYTATLNNGNSITDQTQENTILKWDSLHWSNTNNKVNKNQITYNNNVVNVDIELALQPFTETMAFQEIDPIKIQLEMEESSEIISFYFFKDWWTRPGFYSHFKDVEEQSSIVFYKSKDMYYCLIALPGQVFRSHFEGGEKENTLTLVLSADCGGYTKVHETALFRISDANPYECFRKAMTEAADMYHIPLKEERKYPEIFNKIGWCSWNAFYQDVTEEGMVEKAKEIQDKQIPFGWLLIDDGWQDYENQRMKSFGYNAVKFPNGLKGCVEKMKDITGIDEVGVWHAFNGYWCGIDENGSLYQEHPEWFMHSHQGKILPKPEYAKEFFGNWYQYLNEQKITFVKVDSQSSTRQHYRTNTPIGTTSALLHEGLDWATDTYLQGKLINCMGMAMEDILQRPTSGISRNSDDFFPLEEASFKEHLLQNVFNSLYHNIIYYGDWDMFWSNHKFASKHALLRSLSGGPIYVSDRVGETDPEVLKPTCYEDGTILKANQGAVPTIDCLFNNPDESGYLKLQNECNGVGFIAIYSFIEEDCIVPVGIKDIFSLSNQKYAVYNPMNQNGFVASLEDKWEYHLPKEGYTFYQFAPIENGIAVFGRSDKYLSSHAILSKDKDTIVLKEQGPVLIYAEQKPVCFIDNQEIECKEICPSFYELNISVVSQPCEIKMASH